MPTYEYRCPHGHEFELFQRMSDEPVADCPECGEASERLLSAGAGLLFKGDGFYITDYRPDSYKKAAESDRKSDGGGASKKDSGEAGGKGGDRGGSGTKGSSSSGRGKAGGGASSASGSDSGA